MHYVNLNCCSNYFIVGVIKQRKVAGQGYRRLTRSFTRASFKEKLGFGRKPAWNGPKFLMNLGRDPHKPWSQRRLKANLAAVSRCWSRPTSITFQSNKELLKKLSYVLN